MHHKIWRHWFQILSPFLVSFVGSLCVIPTIYADEIASTTHLESDSGMDRLERNPWRIYAGAAEGYGTVSGSGYSRAPDGAQTLIGGDLSFQIPQWVFETGGGWMYSQLSGSNATGLPISLHTRTGFGDASVRYRLTQRVQVGPAYNLDFGTDTGFGPTVSQSSLSSLVGLRAVYEFPVGNYPLRVVGQALTAIDGGGTQLHAGDRGFTNWIGLG